MNGFARVIRTPCLLLACSLVLTGCGSSQKSGDLSSAVTEYNAQRYEQAHEQAAQATSRAPAGKREEAAYVAGLSAYQLGKTDEAERQFMVAVGSSDVQVAAKSKAMLGQVRMDQRRPREAATLFTEALPHLTGDDAKKCAYNAGIAYQQAGDGASSKRWIAAATTPSVATASDSRAETGGPFTLQVGAFKEKQRAKRAAEDVQSIAKKEGLGEIRVLPRRDERGNPIYVVQVGSFPNRAAAAAARSKIGRLEYIVATMSSSAS